MKTATPTGSRCSTKAAAFCSTAARPPCTWIARVYRVIPEGKGGRHTDVKSTSSGNANHWANFLECVRTRLDWDEREFTVAQEPARGYLNREYRAPWKLEV